MFQKNSNVLDSKALNSGETRGSATLKLAALIAVGILACIVVAVSAYGIFMPTPGF